MPTTRTLTVDRDEPDPAILDEAAEVLRGGGLVPFATETVYGLGADATNPEAIARIYEAKGRPAFNPLIVHADGVDMVRRCVADWPLTARMLAQSCWPGPLTLVLPRSEIIPDLVTAGRHTVGVRVPASKVALGLIAGAGLPIAAPSANRSTGLSPTLARHVLKDLNGKIDLVLDSGPTRLGLESTVVDLTTHRPQLLRPGPISVDRLIVDLGLFLVGADNDSIGALRSPGRLPIHYAPRTPAVRVEVNQLAGFPWPIRAALLVIGGDETLEIQGPVCRIDLATPERASAELYSVLHQWDEQGLDLIVVVVPPDQPEWHAVRDRIWRATSPHLP